MQFGWPLPKRKDLIEKLARTTGRPVHTVFFQQRRLDLPIHPISVELLSEGEVDIWASDCKLWN